jgi:hypothetical protein
MNALAGKPQKMLKWLIRKRIENKITMVLHTIKTEITSAITPTKDHLHHMIATTIMINNLVMIVAAHHRKIAPTPKCAVRAALAETTDKAHCSTMTRKDTNNKHTHLGITNEDIWISDTQTTQKQTKIVSNLINFKQYRRNKPTTDKKINNNT